MSKTSNFTSAQRAELVKLIASAVAEAMNDRTPVTVKNGKGSKAPEPKVQKSAKSIKDFEPKKKDGQYNWASYKANRTHYCYYVATNGDCESNPFGTKWEGKVDYSENSPYYKAKAEFEKKFHYVKFADR